MRILMLGWEFPPFIAGGLGVACYGLTKALDRLGHEIVFILPRPVDRSHTSHIKLLSPDPLRRGRATVTPRAGRRIGVRAAHLAQGEAVSEAASEVGDYSAEFEHVTFHGVNASFSNPYPGGQPVGHVWEAGDAVSKFVREGLAGSHPLAGGAGGGSGSAPEGHAVLPSAPGGHYSGDLVGDAERYARLVVALARRERFDVIHAHDWLTFPAGIALAKATGRPLIVQVHSTEFDRSGENIHRQLYDIERRGMHAADRVLAVSGYTKTICVNRYGVNPAKVEVVYNGIDRDNDQPPAAADIASDDKIVLFLGRITMQKGPEYFISAAARVLEKVAKVKFVVAGSGDMANRMIEQAARLGIGHRVLFTGFLRGRDVERVFRMADCYVMPSVSEPFGLAALEAIHHDVPVIISKQSGVSEVLTHVLKVDFWDVDEMANKIVAVLRHPPLSETLRSHGPFDLRWLTWDGAAEKCVHAYARAIHDRTPAGAT